MKYSNGKINNKPRVKIDSASKRGMSLEEDINVTNTSYLIDDLAVIYKKPTPITIVNVDYPRREKAKITEAYFKLPSTTDYNGIYKSKYIDFEAKECQSETSFPFSSIHTHQIKHLKDVIRHGAIAFIIIRLSKYDNDYLLDATKFIDYYENTKRKSLPFSWIFTNGYLIPKSYQKPCDYLKVIDKVYGI